MSRGRRHVRAERVDPDGIGGPVTVALGTI
jgi:hypothetical protein